MPKQYIFWLIYIILCLFGLGWTWRNPTVRPFGPVIIAILILIGILGWIVCGAMVK